MSEDTKKEKRTYEDGTRRVDHLVVESAKYDAKIKKLDGTTFDGARILCTGHFGSKEIKIAHVSLDKPFNAAIKKQVKDVCDQFKICLANDEELKITYESEYNAKSGFWNPRSVVIGHTGNPGIQRAGGGNGGNSGGGGSYSNEDAQAGQVINIAVAMLQAQAKKGGFDMADVQAKASEIAGEYLAVKSAIKALLKGSKPAVTEQQEQSGAAKTVEGTNAEVAGDGESASVNLDDDDIPF